MTYSRENWISIRSGCVSIIVVSAVMLAFRSATAAGPFPHVGRQPRLAGPAVPGPKDHAYRPTRLHQRGSATIRPSYPGPKLLQHAEPTAIDAEPIPTPKLEEGTNGEFDPPAELDPAIPNLTLDDNPPKPPVELDPDSPVAEGPLPGADETDGGAVLAIKQKEPLPLLDMFRDPDAIFDDDDDTEADDDDRPSGGNGVTSSSHKKTPTSQGDWAPTAAAQKLLAESSTRARISLPTTRTVSYEQPQSLPPNSKKHQIHFVEDRQVRSVLHNNPLRE